MTDDVLSSRASLVSDGRERNCGWGAFRHSLKAPARLPAGGRTPPPPPRSVGRERCQTGLRSDREQRCWCWFYWCAAARLYWGSWRRPGPAAWTRRTWTSGWWDALTRAGGSGSLSARLTGALLSAGVTQSPASGEGHHSPGEATSPRRSQQTCQIRVSADFIPDVTQIHLQRSRTDLPAPRSRSVTSEAGAGDVLLLCACRRADPSSRSCPSPPPSCRATPSPPSSARCSTGAPPPPRPSSGSRSPPAPTCPTSPCEEQNPATLARSGVCRPGGLKQRSRNG